MTADRTPVAQPGEALRAVNVRVSFEGARRGAVATPFRRARSTHLSYVRGATEAWRCDVPLWAGLRYEALYPGVDLVIEARGGRWSARFEAANPEQLRAVRLRVDGATRFAWAAVVLRLETSVGALSLPLHGGAAPTIERATGGVVGRAVQASLGLLIWSNFVGGAQADGARAVAVNAARRNHRRLRDEAPPRRHGDSLQHLPRRKRRRDRLRRRAGAGARSLRGHCGRDDNAAARGAGPSSRASKSCTLRVTLVRPCTRAVAASRRRRRTPRPTRRAPSTAKTMAP